MLRVLVEKKKGLNIKADVEVSEQEILVGLLAVSVCLFNCFGDIDALK